MMLKKLALLFLFSMCLASAACAENYKINLTAEEKLWLRNHPLISIGTMSDWPPLNFTDRSGKPQGVGAAYIEAINKRLGGAVVIHPAPFKENYDKVQKGELDALMDITARPEREAMFDFTRPYISIPHVIVGRKGGDYYRAEKDLSGKTVALERGFYAVTMFRKSYPGVMVREYGSTAEALEAVARGEADAYAGNIAVAIYLIEKELLGNLQLMGTLKGARSVLQIGVAKNQPLLLSILDKGLQSISDDEQHAIYNKWVGLKYEKGMDYALFWKVVGGSVVVILLFLFWNRRMGKEILIRKRAEAELTVYRDGLEKLVRERTAALEREVVERMRSEQAAIVSQQRFRDILDNLADPVYIADMSGKIIAANGQASRELGYTNEELLALDIHDLDAVATTPELLAAQWSDLLKSGGMALDSIHRRKDGSQFPVEINVRLIDFDGEQSVLGVARNVSERKQAEEERHKLEQQLLHAQKLESLGVLAGGIAHDFNNILMAVIGNADLALMRINKESPAAENLRRIEKAAGRAADLAKQMLAYSGKGKFVVESVDLNRLIEEMLHMLEVSVSKKAVLRFNQCQGLSPVEADATQMRQIIMNLVINASEAIGDRSGVINITTGSVECDRSYLKDVWLDEDLSDGRYVYLEVADSGCGMDRDTLAKLFDPFFTTKFTGRGLGMAAVLGIVRGHRGAIKVSSDVGKGTVFKILLPAGSQPVNRIGADSSGDEWQGSGTVLLVDDEETVRSVGAEMLREYGFTVITARNGREALEIFSSTPGIAFVILDLTMPHMDGEQCFCELRRLNPGVKVIISSGYNEHEVTRKFVDKGVAGFIQKPYKLSVLKEAIRGM
ncbi:MAG: transporter substrate-binding domain-containing protein [Desulfuromonadaceae bacterium]|nr:transporter substrate-binding domain-containing protein [Desulfuromonadaceae bacterium]MDD2847189.1 transporter substrate-binding domain-containing protein [Desulfuromonadaceae bacterium]MDD4130133.1 transporter substrate-binding domain-containing protein [Desulfuromonadaceae bacterium]